MNKFTISKLAHRVTFLENTAQNDIEEAKWIEVITSFAEIKPICDDRFVAVEGINFGGVITENYFLFKTRFIKQINSRMRINFRGRTFEIKRIINVDEKDRLLDIIALEI